MPGYPELAAMVSQLQYKPGWKFWLTQGLTSAASAFSTGGPQVSTASWGTAVLWQEPVTLIISIRAQDSTGEHGEIMLEHRFWVPGETFMGPWDEWLLHRVLDVERHEAMEYFAIGDRRPFYPAHGPDARLYAIVRA